VMDEEWLLLLNDFMYLDESALSFLRLFVTVNSVTGIQGIQPLKSPCHLSQWYLLEQEEKPGLCSKQLLKRSRLWSTHSGIEA